MHAATRLAPRCHHHALTLARPMHNHARQIIPRIMPIIITPSFSQSHKFSTVPTRYYADDPASREQRTPKQVEESGSKDSMERRDTDQKPYAAENTLSGTASEAAQQDEAAYGRESDPSKAHAQSGDAKGDSPLDISPANSAVSHNNQSGGPTQTGKNRKNPSGHK